MKNKYTSENNNGLDPLDFQSTLKRESILDDKSTDTVVDDTPTEDHGNVRIISERDHYTAEKRLATNEERRIMSGTKRMLVGMSESDTKRYEEVLAGMERNPEVEKKLQVHFDRDRRGFEDAIPDYSGEVRDDETNDGGVSGTDHGATVRDGASQKTREHSRIWRRILDRGKKKRGFEREEE
jgi:hypothetical protein